MTSVEVQIEVPEAGQIVSATWHVPESPAPGAPTLVLGHGLSNDKDHPLLRQTLDRLAGLGIGGLRFNFPYAERKDAQADPRPLLLAAFGAALRWTRGQGTGGPVVLGGKSLGARMAAAHQATHGDAAGLLYLGFPLHPPTGATEVRAQDLRTVTVPQLCLSGDHDPYCDLALLRGLLPSLRSAFRLEVLPGGDHGLGLDDAEGAAAEAILDRITMAIRVWLSML
jgi:uncharacterized protein